ncbi:calcineurin-like phosphoesterase C-terminal domain-containing protein [Sphingobacterium paucimobilis]|uniref:Calcineurin-like phosphoesterase C-terminal domain-containing protein n=1 Tax=Sphingobacterium paucimobilis HER1398 TaxID=1346330 RepID=U2HU72_9SPHI|nr:calcineurin-like phosphoesterase family protein [Sphingobacterium paucimobilis]ERJ58835.1 hypothetical protein M472_08640 [Sphingobacterium paucimobilis HER1398]
MRFKQIVFWFIFFAVNLAASVADAQSRSSDTIRITGRIYLDDNANGLPDQKERGLKAALVSNGRDIVLTDKKGRYEIQAIKGQSIFPILPSGYSFAKKGIIVTNANFFYLDPESVSSDKMEIHFGLHKLPKEDSFTIGAIGDVQVDNEEELGYASRSVLQELAQRQDLAFNIFLGDLVNDNMPLLPKLKNALEKIATPSWTLVGNHDRNTANPSHMSDVFNRNFGADTYSFNYSGVHFVVLNNVFSTGKNGYEGRVSEDQIQFLKNDLAYVPKYMPVVLSQHIPMAHTRNRQEVIELLTPYHKVLLLSGHTHQITRHYFGHPNIHELGAGATCGNWWTGEKDFDGVPHAIMQCGAPRGYFTVHFHHGDYRIQYKGVGLDASRQIALSVDSLDLIANVYVGSDSTSVQVQFEGGEWLDMQQERRVDPTVLQIIERNRAKVYPLTGTRVNPLGKRKSPHIWKVRIPSTLSPLDRENCRIRVRASDDYGVDFIQEVFLTL